MVRPQSGRGQVCYDGNKAQCEVIHMALLPAAAKQSGARPEEGWRSGPGGLADPTTERVKRVVEGVLGSESQKCGC